MHGPNTRSRGPAFWCVAHNSQKKDLTQNIRNALYFLKCCGSGLLGPGCSEKFLLQVTRRSSGKNCSGQPRSALSPCAQ